MHRLRPGDRRCDRARLSAWLLVRGRGDRPLQAKVEAGEIRAHHSTKKPTIQRGDVAILYASVWQAIFGVVEIVGNPENIPGRERWGWRFEIRPLKVVSDLRAAPPVEAAGVFPQSIWRHSYIRLTDEQFESARKLIEHAA